MPQALLISPDRHSPPPFEKTGKEANPSGRPKMIRAVRDLAREYTEEAILGLVEIGRKESASESARVAAWAEVLNRGWGRAPQHVELDVTVFEGMSEESRALIDAACSLLLAQAQASEARTIEASAIETTPHTDNPPADK